MTLKQLCQSAHQHKLIREFNKRDLESTRSNYRRNLKEPGDCKGDDALLMGLAIAETYYGHQAGWIPVTQKLGVEIAALVKGPL